MKTLSTTFSILFLSTFLSLAQNPLPMLRVYNYDTNNNKIDLEDELSENRENLSFVNIFFSYSKNPLYTETFSPVKIMLFKIKYEYVVQLSVTNTTDTEFSFPLEKHQKVIARKVFVVNESKGILKEQTLKTKYYDTSVSDSSVVYKIDKAGLTDCMFIRFYWKTESEYFHDIRVAPINSKTDGNAYLSLNIPEIFSYNVVSKNLELTGMYESEMLLKQFSYNVSRLVEDISVRNKTFKWKLPGGQQKLTFPIKTINLPERSGTSVEELLHI